MDLNNFSPNHTPDTPKVLANWVRDEDYLLEAVRYSFFDRTPLQRALMPVLAGAAIFLWFSHWGFLPVIFTSTLSWTAAGIIFAGLLLLISSLATYRANLNASRKAYTFRGDAAAWHFSKNQVSYTVVADGEMPSEAGIRHSAQSQWRWYRALSSNADGLRLHRTATEAYVIPLRSIQGPDPAIALAQITDMARKAGLPVRTAAASHWPTTAGCVLMMAMVLTVILSYGAMHAASPHLRYGRIGNLWFSSLETFWWVAMLASPCLVAFHFFLATRLAKYAPGKNQLAFWLHTLAGTAWGLLMVSVLQMSKAWIFDDALMASNFTDAIPLGIVVFACSMAAQLLAVHGAAVWREWYGLQNKPHSTSPAG
jgi:hypothetical protein